MDDLSRFCCQNPQCADYGERGAGNLTACMRFGKEKRLRLLYCRTCHARFSERKGTPLFAARLPEATVYAVLEHLAEGCGIRKTSRLVGVSRGTVARYAGLAGQPAHRVPDEVVAFSPADARGAVRREVGLRGQERQALRSRCPADAKPGDNWDHVALDPEHRLVVSVVPGKRTADNVEKVVQDCKTRTGGRPMNLLTSDEYPAYKPAILNAYGQVVIPPRTGKPGRPKAPYKVAPPELQYATVHKTREKGRVVKVDCRVVCGSAGAVLAALARSLVSTALNTAFIERHNGTDRNRNARKVRKSYGFSKNGDVHEALTYFTLSSYNCCWPVRTLRVRDADGQWQQRTPAMAAGLSDHIWPLSEWLTFPGVQRK